MRCRRTGIGSGGSGVAFGFEKAFVVALANFVTKGGEDERKVDDRDDASLAVDKGGSEPEEEAAEGEAEELLSSARNESAGGGGNSDAAAVVTTTVKKSGDKPTDVFQRDESWEDDLYALLNG